VEKGREVAGQKNYYANACPTLINIDQHLGELD
jgi:hypothetical protein